jgi:hypothetical protein
MDRRSGLIFSVSLSNEGVINDVNVTGDRFYGRRGRYPVSVLLLQRSLEVQLKGSTPQSAARILSRLLAEEVSSVEDEMSDDLRKWTEELLARCECFTATDAHDGSASTIGQLATDVMWFLTHLPGAFVDDVEKEEMIPLCQNEKVQVRTSLHGDTTSPTDSKPQTPMYDRGLTMTVTLKDGRIASIHTQGDLFYGRTGVYTVSIFLTKLTVERILENATVTEAASAIAARYAKERRDLSVEASQWVDQKMQECTAIANNEESTADDIGRLASELLWYLTHQPWSFYEAQVDPIEQARKLREQAGWVGDPRAFSSTVYSRPNSTSSSRWSTAALNKS